MMMFWQLSSCSNFLMLRFASIWAFFFQSKTHLWPVQLIISAHSFSCFNFLSENEERSMNLNNTGLQLWIQFSGNYIFPIFWGNSHERHWQEKVKFQSFRFLVTASLKFFSQTKYMELRKWGKKTFYLPHPPPF